MLARAPVAPPAFIRRGWRTPITGQVSVSFVLDNGSSGTDILGHSSIGAPGIVPENERNWGRFCPALVATEAALHIPVFDQIPKIVREKSSGATTAHILLHYF